MTVECPLPDWTSTTLLFLQDSGNVMEEVAEWFFKVRPLGVLLGISRN